MKCWMFLGLLLLMAFSLPRVYASPDVLEKFPTSTTQVVAGWNDPTYAYDFDDSYATTTTDAAEQEYAGFGFNFNGTEIIDKVSLKLLGTFGMQQVDFPDDLGWMRYDYKLWNGTAWIYEPSPIFPAPSTVWQEPIVGLFASDGTAIANTGLPIYPSEIGRDITNWINTTTQLNNFKMRILFTILDPCTYQEWQLDAISVEVAYTTTTETGSSTSMVPFFFLGIAMTLPIALLVAKKH